MNTDTLCSDDNTVIIAWEDNLRKSIDTGLKAVNIGFTREDIENNH